MRPSEWLRRMEDKVLRWLRPAALPGDGYQDRIDALRARGVRIGSDCWILSSEFSTEPYLVEIGDRVGISSGVRFVTHEGSAWLLRRRLSNVQVFGRIQVGDDSLIGMNSIILPGTTIGARCIVGAGAVVKGVVPDGTVVAGNPARFIRHTAELLEAIEHSPNRLDIWHLDAREREQRIKAHFGIASPPASVATTVVRPRGALR